MTDARDEIMARIHAALADRPAPVPADRSYRAAPAIGDIVDLFAERVGDYRAAVQIVTGAGLPAALSGALSQRGVRTVAAPADLNAVDGVVTGAAVAIATTGTIVLDGGAAQGRRVLTLLPDLHACVVGTDQIVTDVPDAMSCLDPARPLTWISGPSATVTSNSIESKACMGPGGCWSSSCVTDPGTAEALPANHAGARLLPLIRAPASSRSRRRLLLRRG